jgi:hypothetical protein
MWTGLLLLRRSSVRGLFEEEMNRRIKKTTNFLKKWALQGRPHTEELDFYISK